MNNRDLIGLMEFARKKTDELVAVIAKAADPQKVLAWRPGPGRAHLAWQLMHLGATDDRHLNFRVTDGKIVREDYVNRFGGGSTPDDQIPALEEIRRYMAERRGALLAFVAALPEAALTTKPKPDAQWTYEEWIRLLAWHEGHHHGQCQITLNLYRAAGGAGL